MRVAFTNLWHPPGLEAAQVIAADPLRRELARGLAALGHEVHVVQEHAVRRRIVDGSVSWHFVPPSPVARLVRSALSPRADAMVKAPATHLVPVLRTIRPDVVHSFDLAFYPSLALLGHYAQANGIPLVAHYHGGAPARVAPLRAIEHYALGRTDRLLFTNLERGEDWVRSGAIPDSTRILEVPETSSTFTPGPAPRLPGRPALLHAGRLDPVKDPLTVVHGFRRFLKDAPGAHLTLAYTEAPLLAEVRAAAEGLPVTFRGRVEASAMEALHRGADLYVQASLREVCGAAVLEAMAVGTPVVLSDIPPFRRLTDHGRIGALFPVGNAAALAAALRDAPGREPVRPWFDSALSFPALARSMDGLYRGLVSRGATGRQRVP